MNVRRHVVPRVMADDHAYAYSLNMVQFDIHSLRIHFIERKYLFFKPIGNKNLLHFTYE